MHRQLMCCCIRCFLTLSLAGYYHPCTLKPPCTDTVRQSYIPACNLPSPHLIVHFYHPVSSALYIYCAQIISTTSAAYCCLTSMPYTVLDALYRALLTSLAGLLSRAGITGTAGTQEGTIGICEGKPVFLIFLIGGFREE